MRVVSRRLRIKQGCGPRTSLFARQFGVWERWDPSLSHTSPLPSPPPPFAPQSYGDASSSSSLSPPPSAAAFAAPYLGAAAPPAGPPDGELGVSSARLVARMREVEQEGRIFNASAGYVKVRRVLVDFLCEAGEELRLHGSTMHVAVSPALGDRRAATRRDAARGLARLRAQRTRAHAPHARASASAARA